MRPRKRRLLLLAAAFATLIAVLFASGWLAIGSAPSWYDAPPLTAERIEAASSSAQDKLAVLSSQIGDAELARRGVTAQPASQITLTLTEDEINALYVKWSVFNNYDQKIAAYVSSPRLKLLPGQFVLAGRVNQFSSVASLALEPTQADDQSLRVALAAIRAGRLPVPQSMVQSQLDQLSKKLDDVLAENLPYANASPLNKQAVAALLADQLTQLLSGDLVEPLVPMRSSVGNQIILAQLHTVTITEGQLVASADLATPQQLTARLEKAAQQLKSRQPPAAP